MSHPVASPYVPIHKIRIVTAASLFDGHDVAINIMRRILQSTDAEVMDPESWPERTISALGRSAL